MKNIIFIICLILLSSCKEKVEKINPITEMQNQEAALKMIIDSHIKKNQNVYKNPKKGEPDFIITEYKCPMIDKSDLEKPKIEIKNLIYNGHVKNDPEINVTFHFSVVDDEIKSYISKKEEDNKKYIQKYVLSK